jgi:hypothetical protein
MDQHIPLDDGGNLAPEVDEALDKLIDAVSKLDLPPQHVVALLDMVQELSVLLEKQAKPQSGD